MVNKTSLLTLLLLLFFNSFMYAQDCVFKDMQYSQNDFQATISCIENNRSEITDTSSLNGFYHVKFYGKAEFSLIIRPIVDFETFFDLPEVTVEKREEKAGITLFYGVIEEKETTFFTILFDLSRCAGFIITSDEKKETYNVLKRQLKGIGRM